MRGTEYGVYRKAFSDTKAQKKLFEKKYLATVSSRTYSPIQYWVQQLRSGQHTS